MRQSIAWSVVIACSAAASGIASAQSRYDPYHDRDYDRGRQTVRCESVDGRLRECAIDARDGLRLLRQLSRSPCIEGRTWGPHRDHVWVSHGCRAEFAAIDRQNGDHDHDGYGSGQVVRCESNDGRPRQCPVTTRGGVRLVRQLSRTPCVEGRTWGRDRAGIWVSNGCRAEFEVGYRRDQGWGWGRD